jgi:hypothetical protein
VTRSGRLAIGVDEVNMTDVIASLADGLSQIGFLNIHVEQVGQENDVL